MDLCEQQQWPDSVAKPLAFGYTRDLATVAVMDVSYHGPEDLTTFLDTYGIRFWLLEDLRRSRPPGEELPQDPRGRGQTREDQQDRLQPRPVLLSESPPNVEEIRRRTLAERMCHLLREAEDGTPAPSAEDIRDRILLEQARSRPRGSEDYNLLGQRDLGSLAVESKGERDFPPGR